jgi:hypothetical protein
VSLHRLIYISRPVISGAEDINAILETSRRNNNRFALTGVLLFTHEWFVQIIEGGCQTLTERFIAIGTDTRHQDVHLRSFCRIPDRAFDDWNMGYVSHSKADLERLRRFYSTHSFDPSTMDSDSLLAFALASSSQTSVHAVAA